MTGRPPLTSPSPHHPHHLSHHPYPLLWAASGPWFLWDVIELPVPTTATATATTPTTCTSSRVAVLQGGLPAWRAAGLPLDTSPPPSDSHMFAASAACAAPPAAGSAYKARLDKSKVRGAGGGGVEGELEAGWGGETRTGRAQGVMGHAQDGLSGWMDETAMCSCVFLHTHARTCVFQVVPTHPAPRVTTHTHTPPPPRRPPAGPLH